MKRLEDCSFLHRDLWDIYRGPADLLFEARSYEYARQNPERTIAVHYWRAHATTPTFEGCLALYRDPKAPQSPSPVLGSDLYVLFPEWPKDAFHIIDPAGYTQRQQALYPWHERELRARRFQSDSALLLETEYGFDRFTSCLWASWQRFRRWCVRPNNFSETHLMNIDWWDSDRHLLQDFAEWLKVNRPPGCAIGTKIGAGAYSRNYQADLKALAALRLWAAADGKWVDCPPLYLNEADWRSAIKRAEVLIARTYPVAI